MTASVTGSGPRPALLGGSRLASLWGAPPHGFGEVAGGRRMTLSRFAWLRRHADVLIAETSLSPCAVVLEDPRVHALVYALAPGAAVDQALADAVDLPLDAAIEVASLLLAASVLIDAEKTSSEDEPPLAVWEFHDLLFHARSRPGRHRARTGGTYRFRERFPMAPALPPPRWQEAVELPRPDWERLEREDPPLAAVQSARRSVREFGSEPMTLGQLAEFLYRVGRVEDLWEAPGGALVAKPYPSGGGLYELEIYVAVQACVGLEPGLYHYASDTHRLARVAGTSAELDRLIAGDAAGMGIAPKSLQVLLVVTARMGRIAWKYESIAYALVLKHVGVLIQTMYLSATAMGLAPCAIGTGDSDQFARVSGIDYYEEPAVGEFALGSRRPPR
jgi:SagB-type dehydrogenase family enzyme